MIQQKARPKKTGQTRSARRGRTGFTLLEMIVSLSVVSLLFLGAMDLFVASLRTVGRVNADVFSAADGANVMRRLTEDAREARWVALPSDPPVSGTANDFTNAGYTPNTYRAVVNGQWVDAAVLLVYPSPQTGTAYVGDTTGNAPGMAVTDAPYDRTTDGPRLLIYRSDVDGTPDPAAGQYLWAIGQEPGRPSVPAPGCLIRRINYEYDRRPGQPVDPTRAAPNAVQFTRPTGSDGKTFVQDEMEIKLIVSDYSPVNGVQTSEGAGVAGDMRVSALTGKCVLLRDHEVPPLSHGPSVAVTATNNVWAAD